MDLPYYCKIPHYASNFANMIDYDLENHRKKMRKTWNRNLLNSSFNNVLK